jgi:MoaA/NifB/PqqE/SkfB family radical SAM enzyme
MGHGVTKREVRLPARLNLSIGHSCWTRCPGCYSAFGQTAPDLARFVVSVAAFVRCGVRDVTLSGGDPLRISHLLEFLESLRRVGVRSIKVDTVGTALLPGAQSLDRAALLRQVDILGLPLDGWDQVSVAWFRRGRPRLFDETIDLLTEVDRAQPAASLYVHTVVHRRNIVGLERILEILRPLRHLRRWVLFQYTPTDQPQPGVNEMFAVPDAAFAAARRGMASLAARRARHVDIEFASNAERLGQYLLINSDGDSWIPDACGRTVSLGHVFGREHDILSAWRRATARLVHTSADRVSA